jgi:2'-5' RNA ligase
MIEYSKNTDQWEDWQSEYQFGAFYIFPPDEVIGPIDELRRTYDPKSDSICQAHISLSESLKTPVTDEQIEEIRQALSTIEPFTITYGPLRWFPPHPGVVYTIEPESGFRKLRNALHATTPFKDVPLRREHIAPHMTIAEFITAERTE